MLRARRENYKVKKVTDSNPVSLEKVIENGNIFQLLLVQKKSQPDKTIIQKDTCTLMIIAPLFTAAKI